MEIATTAAKVSAMRHVKMKDVATAAGVSVMTVSRALRKDGRIAPETRRQILGVVERMGYVPDQIAASFSSQRSGFVAALVPSLNNSHFAETIRVISEAIEDEGLQILLGQTNYQPDREERLLAALLSRRPEGIVLTADLHSARTRRLLASAGIPVIETWDVQPVSAHHQVGFSNVEASRAMVRHLASRGYERIVYVGETQDEGTRGARRREGYKLGLAEAGLGAPRIHLQCAPPVSMTEGRKAFHVVRQLWPDADAIMCVSDPCAFGVMTEAITQGLDVPGALGVAGFGDFEIGRCAVPPITTVGIDVSQMALAAAGLLRNPQGPAGGARTISVPFDVVPRASTR
jgi:LacI family transcriptional regulator, gluconate utilization system Gnt-I transcriptional repressor